MNDIHTKCQETRTKTRACLYV